MFPMIGTGADAVSMPEEERVVAEVGRQTPDRFRGLKLGDRTRIEMSRKAPMAPGGGQINLAGPFGEEHHDLKRQRTDFLVREMAETDGTDGLSKVNQ
jgi:hypothetical protein